MSKRKSEKKGRRIGYSFLSGGISFVVLGLLYLSMIRHDLLSERERYTYMARNEADHIATTIDCVMARTVTLKEMLQDHNGDTSFFSRVAEDIYNTVTEETGIRLKNLAVAPDGVVSEVFPLSGNEALIGFDFLDISHTGNLEAKEAYEGGGTILTNPFKLIQGGVGMGGRSAVILKNGDKEELWGLVTVTIDYDNLMEVLKLDNMEGMGVDYELSYFDDNGERHLLQMAGDPDEHAVTTRFRVRNLSWELRVSPQKGWISFWRVFISAAILLLVSILAGLFTSTMLKLRESNATLHRLSVTDGLTGSLNRRAYEEALAEIAKAPADKDFIYISADLNGLKHTNDTYGHPAGDELINGAKDCLQEIFSACGKVYRTGGDEFVALIYADEKSVEGLIEKLHALTKEWKGEGVNELSLSVGYSSYREFPEATMEQLIKTADERMYEQKRAYYQANGYDRRKH